MINIALIIILFFILTKAMLFWLWLWQLKEYHCGRMRAHFETQKIRKAVASLTRFKYPKLTNKTLIIIFVGLLMEILVLAWLASLSTKLFYVVALISIITAPIIFSLLVLLFQIPTVILKNRLLKKAKQKREKFKNLIVVGITGSYGKTSTKEFLATLLAEKQRVLKTEKHINAEIGIAQTILNDLTEEHEIFIAEIGAYNSGKIKQVCRMLQPKIGILTGINEQHMSTFGSQENIIKAKFELIQSLPVQGIAILNDSDPKIKNEKFKIKNYNSKLKIIKFISKNDMPFVFGENILPWDVENVAMAVAAAEALGMSQEEIARGMKKIKSPLQIEKGVDGLSVINSTYSANPNSVIAHLDYLRTWQGNPQSAELRRARKIIIMPCLIELGKASKAIHRKIGEGIGRICDLAVITTKDYFKELKAGAQENGMAAENILLLENPKQILEKIKSFAASGDIILLESRVPQGLIDSLIGQ